MEKQRHQTATDGETGIETKTEIFLSGVKFRKGTENNENHIFTHTQSRALPTQENPALTGKW